MATNEPLPDSGGHYYDTESDDGFVAVSRRNVEKAKEAVFDGEVGATVVATAVGFAIGKFITGGN